MIRAVELSLFLLPFVIYFGWRRFVVTGRVPTRNALLVLVAGLLALGGGLAWSGAAGAAQGRHAIHTRAIAGWADRARPWGVTRPDFLNDPAVLAVLGALPAARLVGGCVRDALAGHPVADIDLATPTCRRP